MTDDLKMERETLTIEGDRNLYSYTFTDAFGRRLEPEPIVHPEGNLPSLEKPEDRKG